MYENLTYYGVSLYHVVVVLHVLTNSVCRTTLSHSEGRASSILGCGVIISRKFGDCSCSESAGRISIVHRYVATYTTVLTAGWTRAYRRLCVECKCQEKKKKIVVVVVVVVVNDVGTLPVSTGKWTGEFYSASEPSHVHDVWLPSWLDITLPAD